MDEPSVLMLGLGRMGLPMAIRLADNGVRLHVHDLNREAVRAAVGRGCLAASAPALDDLDFDRVLLCLPAPSAVEQWLDTWAGLRRARRTVIADFTTMSPRIAVANRERLQGAGIGYLDCPISGGERGAVSGDLVLTAGGDDDDYRAIEPLLRKVGSLVLHMGKIGSGSLLKAVNQSIYLAYNYAFTRGVEVAVKSGLPRAAAMEALARGAAGHPLINDRLFGRDGGPAGVFALARALKDLDFLEPGSEVPAAALELHELVRREFGAAVDRGQGGLDIFSLADI